MRRIGGDCQSLTLKIALLSIRQENYPCNYTNGIYSRRAGIANAMSGMLLASRMASYGFARTFATPIAR
jgi:hypothetical protein